MCKIDNYKSTGTISIKTERSSECGEYASITQINNICTSIYNFFREKQKYDGYNFLCCLYDYLGAMNDVSVLSKDILRIIDENELVLILMSNILDNDMKIREI